ncbi:MAG: SpoVR family protein [bacterium]
MEIVDQRTKAIMEGCKERARDAGLSFQDESLEYIVTNRDLLELMPKGMIPTLYDYWVHDVEVLREKGKYELYPHNPYETVINTRPAISFFNDNNPDWLNVMIFYHVLAHIDFFQNNYYFRHTWDYDFTGRALSDKRIISRLRAEKGRWADYVLEFGRGIDNLVGYHQKLSRLNRAPVRNGSRRLDYYFDVFLQSVKRVRTNDFVSEIERYNECKRQHGDRGEQRFFEEVEQQHPEFQTLFEKEKPREEPQKQDLYEYLLDHSPFLSREENKWMKMVLQVTRGTSMFFQPQIRTKIMNEGWASYWHETLFLQDDRIQGHEVEFARVNARVTAMPRVGLNPYALGMRLFFFIEEFAGQGRYSRDYNRLRDVTARDKFTRDGTDGRDFIYQIRENLCDFTFVNSYVDQDFVNRYKLFVVGRRLNQDRMVWEYYIKSRKAEEYRQMLLESMYHPPHISVDPERGDNGALYLVHHFEEKPLVRDFIHNTMIGIEYLWGSKVQLETHEVKPRVSSAASSAAENEAEPEVEWEKVLYSVENRKLTRKTL